MQEFLERIKSEDMSIERPGYTYLCFINKAKADECTHASESKIKHYVFGHTHRAGIAGDASFKIYNTGSWARKARWSAGSARMGTA